MTEFKSGDWVVYPAHGVCQVSALVNRIVGRHAKRFYVLKSEASGLTIMIPLGETTVRPVSSRREAFAALGYAKDRLVKGRDQTWNSRYREFMEDIKSGSLSRILTVIKSLYAIREGQELSFGERKLLEQAVSLAARELQLSIPERDAESLLTVYLK